MKKKKRSAKNLKISTRITLSTILGIIVPLAVVFVFSSFFIQTMASYFNVSTVDSNYYSMINQIQWNQTVTYISDELVSDNTLQVKRKAKSKIAAPLEKLGTEIYIENNLNEEIYSTNSREEIFHTAGKIIPINLSENTRHFSQRGMVIISHVDDDDENTTYTLLIANDQYMCTNFHRFF